MGGFGPAAQQPAGLSTLRSSSCTFRAREKLGVPLCSACALRSSRGSWPGRKHAERTPSRNRASSLSMARITTTGDQRRAVDRRRGQVGGDPAPSAGPVPGSHRTAGAGGKKGVVIPNRVDRLPCSLPPGGGGRWKQINATWSKPSGQRKWTRARPRRCSLHQRGLDTVLSEGTSTVSTSHSTSSRDAGTDGIPEKIRELARFRLTSGVQCKSRKKAGRAGPSRTDAALEDEAR